MAVDLPAHGETNWDAKLNQALSAHDDAIGGLAPRVKLINGDPGPEVTLGLTSLPDVELTAPTYDDNGVVLDPGVRGGEGLFYDEVDDLWRNLPVDPKGHSHDDRYAPLDPNSRWVLRGVALDPGQAVPDDLPEGYLIFDAGRPARLLTESVNTVLASGTTQTLPDMLTASMHDITLTANCTFVFPTPVAGQSFTLLLRQDATGNRLVTWPTTAKWASPGTAPTLSTVAGREDLLEFVCVAGANWRLKAPMQSFNGTPQPQASPTVRGSFGNTSGALNNATQTTAVLPTGIQNGDTAYAMVYLSGSVDTLTGLGGFTSMDGPIGTTTQRAYLLKKTCTTADSGATVTFTVSAGQRPGCVGVVVAGKGSDAEVFASSIDSSNDSTLDVPAITPTVGNSLLVHLAANRFAIYTPPAAGPTVTASTQPSQWTEQKEVHEGRGGTSVEFGAYAETRALTGQGNVLQSAVTADYSPGPNAQDISYVIAVPPAVV